ncbi:MAG TPA: 3-isopropylmalate dehydratase large subunit, partial [Ilumatobacteraceae bacterium]|nr:3-isopropylmalate dehydratase large subunit [Ilumatobacteraceae bacterium]
ALSPPLRPPCSLRTCCAKFLAVPPGQTMFDKVWHAHEITRLSGGSSLLHVDRHLIHDLEAGPDLARLEARHIRVRRPDLTYATPDHAISSAPGRTTDTNPAGGDLLREMRRRCASAGIRLFDLGEPGQGIVHVIGPELGITQPGMLIVCADSHTCTHGGLGAMAWGIGASEAMHVLATQTIRQQRPQAMRVSFTGTPRPTVTAKDLVMHAIGSLGVAAGRGHAVEWAGDTTRALGIEERLTLCNMSIEMGAKIGMIAPDDTTYEYLAGRPMAPRGELLDEAVAAWRSLPSDDDAMFAREHTLDVSSLGPRVTWGTTPEHVIPIDGTIPDPDDETDPQRRTAMRDALTYMGLRPGEVIAGTPIDWVFIGSCANSRLTDLRAAAGVVRGRHVAPRVRAWVVPGSEEVKRAAESEGLHHVFRAAGFEWREPGCSMCLAANGERVGPGERSVSTSNRNFVGRQGPDARTHLASPLVAAASALAGAISQPDAVGR